MPASIDCLPLDALVQILCKLSHDELKPLLRVSKSFRNAALVARQSHFDFSTPVPNKTLALNGGTPDAPSMKLESRKPRKCKLSEDETRRIAVVLFPVADCEWKLPQKPGRRPCGIAPHCKQPPITLWNAQA